MFERGLVTNIVPPANKFLLTRHLGVALHVGDLALELLFGLGSCLVLLLQLRPANKKIVTFGIIQVIVCAVVHDLVLFTLKTKLQT